jgi:diguanylate cyclase (GGDEF)-like protein
MVFLSWFDDRTLMVCFCMVVTVFSFMLLALRLLHPRSPGLPSVTAGFATGAFAIILLFSQGSLSQNLSILGGGATSFLSSLLIYRGVLQFCRHQRPASGSGFLPLRKPPALRRDFLLSVSAFSLLSLAALAWFTVVQPSEPVRVVLIAGTMALTRWLISWTLLRVDRGRPHLRALGISVGVVALVLTAQAFAGAFSTGAAHHLDPSHLETPALLFGVLVASIQGVLFLMMFAGIVTESIHEQAQLDYLTGVLNRRGIQATLDSEVARTRRTRACFAMLLIDVDHFKAINDRCGHACGDESLRLVAQTICRTIRVYDRLGRFGGDEFLLLLPQTDSAEAIATAARIVTEVRKLPPRMTGLSITVSIGATCCSSEEDSIEIIRRADAALYSAKRSGRDRAHINLGDGIIEGTSSPAAAFGPADSAETPSPLLIPENSLPSEV